MYVSNTAIGREDLLCGKKPFYARYISKTVCFGIAQWWLDKFPHDIGTHTHQVVCAQQGISVLVFEDAAAAILSTESFKADASDKIVSND